jgi:hypothetical protein
LKYIQIIISFQVEKNTCGVLVLKNFVDYSGTPKILNIDGVDLILAGWASKMGKRMPIYLQLTNLSLTRQKFALNTGFYALKNDGYSVDDI